MYHRRFAGYILNHVHIHVSRNIPRLLTSVHVLTQLQLHYNKPHSRASRDRLQVANSLYFSIVSIHNGDYHGGTKERQVRNLAELEPFTRLTEQHHCRKRKFTDKSLPSSMLKSVDFPDSKFYQQLLDMERKLDWTIARKRVEVQDALGKGNYVRS